MPQPVSVSAWLSASEMGSNMDKDSGGGGGDGQKADPQSGPHECNSVSPSHSPLPSRAHSQSPQPPIQTENPIKSNNRNPHLHKHNWNNVNPHIVIINKDSDPKTPIPANNENEPSSLRIMRSLPPSTADKPKIENLTKKIKSHPTLSPLRKKTYLLLLTSVPAGHWTTYAALAKKLSSSPRAVGTAMRMNPFAPDVPCHRVLGVDGALGGYMGTRPVKSTNGKEVQSVGNLGRKRHMLEDEGVRFDERGRAERRGFVSLI
ncbi:6-O-methylguanine DNA methyltransferase [Aspergillus crustosus]